MNRSNELNSTLQDPDSIVIKKEIAKELNISLAEVEDVKSTYAWDICRLSALSKWCYWCEYISLEEMWQFITLGATKATERGNSWKEYTISFLLGRTTQGFDLEDVIDECKELYHSKKSTLSWIFRTKNLDVYKKYKF